MHIASCTSCVAGVPFRKLSRGVCNLEELRSWRQIDACLLVFMCMFFQPFKLTNSFISDQPCAVSCRVTGGSSNLPTVSVLVLTLEGSFFFFFFEGSSLLRMFSTGSLADGCVKWHVMLVYCIQI